MRITPPGSLRLDSTELLDELRERVNERAPGFLEELDRIHPAWILMQEAAWLVETMSAQLDEYPYAVVRQFAHMLGAQLRPAQPAVGVVVVNSTGEGTLELGANPARWRFFTPQSEEHGLIEFALAEEAAPVRPASITEMARIVDGELHSAGAGVGQYAWVGSPQRTDIFGGEFAEYTMLVADAEKTEKALQEATEKLQKERNVGWLETRVERNGDVLKLFARIDPAAAFDLPGLTAGGDIEGSYGVLDESSWVPPVRIADHPLLPGPLRGSRPLPGRAQNTILLPDIPANVHTEDLLTRDAVPAPAEVVDAIWQTLVHLDSRLKALQPAITRGVLPSEEGELDWVGGALRQGAWFQVADYPDQTIAHIGFEEAAESDGRLRAGWVLKRGATPRLRAFGLHPEHGVLPDPLGFEPVWDLLLPAPNSGGLVQAVAVDIDIPAGCNGVLLTCDGEALGTLVNPLLVINAPVVRDGRGITIQRSIPEPVTLIHEDIVDGYVMDQLIGQGLSGAVAANLRSMRLSRVDIEGRDRISDFKGMQLDPSEGHLVLNAPDRNGACYRLRRGDTAQVQWYRRTDAATGNVSPGEIALVEQGPTTRPRLSEVTNPLGTSWGAAREEEDAAVQRMFGPLMSTPITPGDWERTFRHALGTRAEGWLIRVWGHAERSLMGHALWPPHGPEQRDQETERLEEAISRAEPDTLLVVLGPTDSLIDSDELDWAREVIRGAVEEWRQRIPVARDVIVTRLWPIKLRTTIAPDHPVPFFGIRGIKGTLLDQEGHRALPPNATLLLNAAIVDVEVR